uniref:Uncharacterized protein n=1 Tax=Arundo donax TaxID=35708 RepID=A0A0A9DXB1_ARUDO
MCSDVGENCSKRETNDQIKGWELQNCKINFLRGGTGMNQAVDNRKLLHNDPSYTSHRFLSKIRSYCTRRYGMKTCIPSLLI